MITLITAGPGGGKSLLTVQEFIRGAVNEGRRVFCDGIPDLVLEHEPVPPLEEWTTRVPDASRQAGYKLVFTFPEGALVVVDEAQSIFRARGVGTKVPDAVVALETHRHQGLDFVLITQGPGLIDPNIRKLVGRHIHLRDLGILGRRRYEWPECANPEQFRLAPVQGRFVPDKKCFSLYRSASLHVPPVRGLPKGVLALALLVPLLIGLTVFSYRSVAGKVEKATEPAKVAVAAGGGGVAYSPAAVSVDGLTVEMVPRVRGRPETAPAFDELRKVRSMPVVVGCLAVAERCRCFTQQGTDAGLSIGECKAWLERPPFNPYVDERREEPRRAERDERREDVEARGDAREPRRDSGRLSRVREL